ncbi:hypothetical protein BDF19DRAFT_450069 [Syncephalis fuscata]|nr:hypothetical protein BDF19DRAFT_450069 [Syncephalis fuscata]
MQLRTKHAQVRLATVQLLVVLYERSQHARTLVHGDINDWIQLTVGVHNERLPPPKEYANRLRQLMLNSIRDWYDRRGDRHRELRLAYEYLKQNAGVDFGNTKGSVARMTHRNDETAEEKQERIQRNARLKRYEAIRQTIERGTLTVVENLTDMESCFDILVPKLFEDTLEKPMQNSEEKYNNNNNTTLRQMVHEHGLGSSRYALTINLNDSDHAEVQEIPENRILFEELRTGRRLLKTRHLERITGWLDALGHSESENPVERETLLKDCIDLKERIEEALNKCDEMGITDERDEDDLFEVVAVNAEPVDSANQLEDIQTNAASIQSTKSTLQGLFAPNDFPDIEQDPTYAHNTSRPLAQSEVAKGKQPMVADKDEDNEAESSDPQRAALMATAPYIEYGDDIHYWNDREISINSSGLELSHRFYGTANPDSVLSNAGMERYRLRAVPLSHITDASTSSTNDPSTSTNASNTNSSCKVNPSIKSSANSSKQLWEQIADDVGKQTNAPAIVNGRSRRKRTKYDGPGLIDIYKQPKKTAHERIIERFSDKGTRKMAEQSMVYRQRLRDRDRKLARW